MQHLDLVSLSCFVETARTGSIRKASEQLHMTPSAISRRIATLERQLQTVLFVRQTTGVTLTQSGGILLLEAESIARKVSKVYGLIGDIEDLRRGEVTIYCMEGAVDHWMANIISKFRMNHPAILFHVVVSSTDHSIDALIKGDCDIAIVLRAPRCPEIEVIKSSSEPMVVVAAPDHEVVKFHSITFLDALQYDLVLPRADFGVRQLIDRNLALHNTHAQIAFTANSIAMIRSIVRCGDAITLLPYLSVRHECTLGLLKAIPINPFGEISAQIDLCISKDRPLTAAARKMLSTLTGSFSSFVACV